MSGRATLRNLLTTMLLAILAGLGTTSCSSRRATADLVIRADAIYTAFPARPKVEAVAVREGRIVDLGNWSAIRKQVGRQTEVLRYKKAVVLPGLIDAHAHLSSLGQALSELDLTGTAGPEEIAQMVAAEMRIAGTEEWILGRGWDQNDWEETNFPTWRDLREAERLPVVLRRVDGHAIWVNRTAMRVAGISTSTPDPKGGRIVRDRAGRPTGVFIDRAADLITRHIPEPTRMQRESWIRSAMDECNRLGLVGVHDAGIDSVTLAIYRGLERRGRLTMRIYAMLDGDDEVFVEQEMLRGPQGEAQDLLRVRAVKMYADGALGSRGALLLEPYSDDTTRYGLAVSSKEQLLDMGRRVRERGYQFCVHAIGDSANRMMLDVYSALLGGPLNGGDQRWRIEHAQILDSLDIPRFATLGVVASMQPTHATSDMPWAQQRLGRERVEEGAYAWRKLLDSGAIIAFGSDFPVENPNPLLGLYAAVTRQDRFGQPDSGWVPSQRLTMEEALEGFTRRAAEAEFADRVRGTIEKGKLADFTVIDVDPFEEEPKALLDAKVIATILAGEVVYSADEGEEK